jgi:high-affinity iron transporter
MTGVRRWLGGLLVAVAALVGISLLGASPASAQTISLSRAEAIAELHKVRQSIDDTLTLVKAGQADAAFKAAIAGYLSHFEQVEIPLRVVDNALTVQAEGLFAEIRQDIRNGAPVDQTRDKIIELRKVIDETERRLTSTGVGAPMLVMGQSFLIIFREGFEVVLLLSVLLGYLEAARSTHFIKPVLAGVGLAALATVATVLALQLLFAALPISTEVLEAFTALIAVVMLFYVSFWLIARLEHKRWMEFIKARMWSAVSVGSAASMVLLGFTAVYREGFETALFYQALLSFGSGLHLYIGLGILLGVGALAVVSYAMFHLGRKLPVKVFMNTAVVLVMATSVAFLGNAIHALQTADVVGYTHLDNWPELPIFLSQATGYWPTVETVGAQLGLTVVYVGGALYMFVVRPRLQQRQSAPRPVAQPPAPVAVS